MKKIIYEKRPMIIYLGEIKELKFILEEIVLIQWGNKTFTELKENITYLENINENLQYSSKLERIYYSKENIIYRPNGTYFDTFKLTIKPNSIRADKIFLDKNPQYKIEIEEK